MRWRGEEEEERRRRRGEERGGEVRRGGGERDYSKAKSREIKCEIPP